MTVLVWINNNRLRSTIMEIESLILNIFINVRIGDRFGIRIPVLNIHLKTILVSLSHFFTSRDIKITKAQRVIASARRCIAPALFYLSCHQNYLRPKSYYECQALYRSCTFLPLVTSKLIRPKELLRVPGAVLLLHFFTSRAIPVYQANKLKIYLIMVKSGS